MSNPTSKRSAGSKPQASEHALRLYAFLETEWDAMQIAPTTWCNRVGIPDPTVYRWKQGVEPDTSSLRRVAEALGRPVLDILVAAGYVSQAEANGHVPPPRVYTIAEALELDQSVSPGVREALRQVLDVLLAQEVNPKRKRTVKGSLDVDTPARRPRARR